MSILATVADGGDEQPRGAPASAPYMSYRGFKGFLEKFAEPNGLPARLDKSYFNGASGSLVAQVRGTLKYFDLIDDAYEPTDMLREIINAAEADQRDFLKMIFEEKYADALALNKNATAGQLAEVFRTRGISGATVQKAISFFLSMAEDVGVEVSSHFRTGRAVSTSTPRKRAAKKTAVKDVAPPAPPAPRVTSAEAQKAKYIDMLMELASKGDTPQADLLDRIERALNIGDSEAPTVTPPHGSGGGD